MESRAQRAINYAQGLIGLAKTNNARNFAEKRKSIARDLYKVFYDFI